MSFSIIIHVFFKEIKSKIISETRQLRVGSTFVLIIMSHGGKDYLLGTDAVPVFVDEIITMLDGNNTPIMQDRPKVLIIQACRNPGTSNIVIYS